MHLAEGAILDLDGGLGFGLGLSHGLGLRFRFGLGLRIRFSFRLSFRFGATILQRFEDGTLKYIEPQVYSETVGAKRSIEELSTDGAVKPIKTRGILRVDNKLFNTKFISIFDK